MYKKYRMETPNPKCPRCKCYWKPDETDIKSSGLSFKTCKKCRDYRKYSNIIICPCGSSFKQCNRKDHEISKKHIEFTQNQPN